MIVLHLLIVWALVSGLARKVIEVVKGPIEVKVIEDGIGEQKFSGFEHMQPMPGFADKLSPEQLTDLLNYLRQGWGGQTSDLAVSDVQKLRADAPPLEHKAH